MTSYYFHWSLFGYLIGMVATYGALSLFHTPQPALLYILPCQLVTYLVSAYINRDLKRMITYDEDRELDSVSTK